MNVCLLYNFAQHYRLPVYKLLENEINIDFFFGQNQTDIASFPYNELNKFKKLYKTFSIYKGIYCMPKSLELAFKPYSHYIILAEYMNLTNWLLCIILRLRRRKIVFWTHGLYGKEGFFKRNIIKSFFKLAHHIFVYNNRGKDLLVKEGFRQQNISVIYNSLNAEEQSLIYKGLVESNIFIKRFNNKNPNLVYIGRLQKRKKIEQVLQAMSILEKSHNVYVNFVVIGNGDQSKPLRSLAKELKLEDRIWFVGELYDEREIAQYLYNGTLGVSPGNIGLTAVHFFAYGLPFVTHDDFRFQMPEYEIMTPNNTGMFFRLDDVESLATAIKVWLEKNDESDRSAIRKACRLEIEMFYNPRYQLKVIKQCLESLASD